MNSDALEAALGRGWTLSSDSKSISKTFTFANFADAFAFMTLCAESAEALGHHPDWTNVYNTVQVTLTTHDADALTALDYKLAKLMDDHAGPSRSNSRL